MNMEKADSSRGDQGASPADGTSPEATRASSKAESAASAPSEAGATAPKPASVGSLGKRRGGRVGRFFRKVLVWLVLVAVGFAAGVATYHFVRYEPQSEDLAQARMERDLADQSIAKLQAQIEAQNASLQEANNTITSLQGEKLALQDELGATTARLNLMQVLVDVTSARVALFGDDVERAKAALLDTQQRLSDLLPAIGEVDSALAESMPQRLNLIISGMDRNVETAKVDLELLTKDLLEVAAALSGSNPEEALNE